MRSPRFGTLLLVLIVMVLAPVVAEGERLLNFVAPDAERHEVVIE